MMEVRLSVRELVEFVLRGGSIDNRYGSVDAMAQGSRAHRKLQKEAGEGYRAEVALSIQKEYNGICFSISGRADGVIKQETGWRIDEIKTVSMPLELIEEDFNRLHWAQAECYGYFYAVENGLEEIQLQLTYYNVEQEQKKQFVRRVTLQEMETFFLDLLKRYQKWADMQSKWMDTRQKSLQALRFPFSSYRKGQREMAVAVYRCIQQEERLFCEAPTGIGKTMSVLFPALKAMGEGLEEKIFYLTAKTMTRQAAQEAVELLRGQGARVKSVTLTAKDKICFLQERNCNPEACPYANGHFDRVNEALFSMLEEEEEFGREVVESWAKRFRVCPFELSLDLTLWCDVVICDYNYLFDPAVMLKRFFSDSSSGQWVFLIDEAHNLVHRAREMYSAHISKQSILQARRAVGKQQKPLYTVLGKVNEQLLSLRKECGQKPYDVRKQAQEDLNQWLQRLAGVCELWLKEHKGSAAEPIVLELYFQVLGYVRISQIYDACYVTMLEKQGKDFVVKQLCLDPAQLLDQCMSQGRATALFSATLSPIGYYGAVLGGTPGSKCCVLQSPFPRENLKVVVVPSVNTRYRGRQDSVPGVAQLIQAAVSARRGNYMVFFPSYQYMEQVAGYCAAHCSDMELAVQSGQMSEQERETFLDRFQAGEEKSLVGFCVLGGVFSEGIDLKGDRLIGSLIVGVGLPQINPQTDLLREYYNEKMGDGFAFAYQYPGMNKVLQAAGRVIRGEEDRGIVILMDDRFVTPFYQQLMPEHWKERVCVQTPQQLKDELKLFWKENE